MIPINDLSRNSDLSDDFFEELKLLVKSGQFINGKHTYLFEESLKNIIGADFAIGVSSGTAALDLALRALDLPEGAGVMLSANAGGYARVALNQNRLKPIYVDVDVNGLIRKDSLENLIYGNKNSAKVLILTYIYGQCSNLTEIREFVHENNLLLIEDCAQSIGAKTSNFMAGNIGDISTFSFYPTKNLGAIGDAGAVTTSDATLANRIRSLKQYGWNQKYSVEIRNGSNQRIDEIQAFAVNHMINRLEFKTFLRKQIWNLYNISAGKSGLRLVGSKDESFVAHLGIIDCNGRRPLIRKFLNDIGISTDIHYPIPDHKQSAWVDNAISLPETERQARDFITIPLFPELTKDEVSQICIALEEIGSKI